MTTLTKRQLEMIIRAWNVGNVPIPSKNSLVTVYFPDTPDYDFKQAILKKTDLKSTEGRVLYSVEFKN